MEPPPPNLAPQNEPLAIAALVTGILSIVFSAVCGLFSLPLSIAAVVLGFLARGKIAKSGGTLTGSGMALAGIITGVVGLLIFGAAIVIGILLAVASAAGSGH